MVVPLSSAALFFFFFFLIFLKFKKKINKNPITWSLKIKLIWHKIRLIQKYVSIYISQMRLAFIIWGVSDTLLIHSISHYQTCVICHHLFVMFYDFYIYIFLLIIILSFCFSLTHSLSFSLVHLLSFHMWIYHAKFVNLCLFCFSCF